VALTRRVVAELMAPPARLAMVEAKALAEAAAFPSSFDKGRLVIPSFCSNFGIFAVPVDSCNWLFWNRKSCVFGGNYVGQNQ